MAFLITLLLCMDFEAKPMSFAYCCSMRSDGSVGLEYVCLACEADGCVLALLLVLHIYFPVHFHCSSLL